MSAVPPPRPRCSLPLSRGVLAHRGAPDASTSTGSQKDSSGPASSSTAFKKAVFTRPVPLREVEIVR